MKKYSKELKPCPFCNGEADGVKVSVFWYAFCKICGCEIEGLTKEEVFEKWNRRIILQGSAYGKYYITN